MIGESKLDDSFLNAQFHVNNFTLHRYDRNARGGGVMVYLNNVIPHRLRSDLNAYVASGLEGLIFEINISKKKWLIAGLYKPPNMSDIIFKQVFCKILDEMFSDCQNVIVTGDLNFNMNEHNILHDLCNIYNLKNKVTENTCFKNESGTLLDVFLVSNRYCFGECLNTDIGVSDFHNIVGCSIKGNLPYNMKKVISYRSYKKFDIEKFHNDLDNIPTDECITSANVDKQMNDFINAYTNVVNDHVPLKKKIIKKQQVPFMNRELKCEIFKKSMFRNKYYKCRNSENWNKYKTQRNLVTKLRKNSIRYYFQSKCENDKNQIQFWKMIKPFVSKNCHNGSDNIVLREGNDIITDPLTVCNIFNEFYASVANDIGFVDKLICEDNGKPVLSSIFSRHSDHYSIKLINDNVRVRECFNFAYTTEYNIFNVLNKIDTKKSTGFDNLPPKIIKYSIDFLVPFLTKIINKCIDECIFPSHLKFAEIASIFKKKDNLNKENYRPVSVLIVLSKIFEKIYSKQIGLFFTKIFNPLLSAYRSKYGCHNVLLKLTEEWKYALDNNMYSGALLMDLSKAFDCLPHCLIICKLKAYGFSDNACLLLTSYLNDRKQRVKLGNCRSNWSLLCKGVPQGSILGPLIFNIFVHDMYYDIKKSILFNYADDNTLFFTSQSLTELVDTLTGEAEVALRWFKLNGMQANAEKFQFIVSHRSYKEEVSLNVNGSIIKSEDNVKLLGVTIDRHLSFDIHVQDLCKKAGKQLGVLRRFASILSVENKLSIYHSFILSQFHFCPVIWHFCKKGKIDMMEKIQERALRFVYSDNMSSYGQLLSRANRCTLYNDRLRCIAIEVFKSINGINPEYLHNSFKTKICHYNLRDKNVVTQPMVNTVKYGLLSFRYHGAKIWNMLPTHIKSSNDLDTFKTLLFQWEGHLCNCSFCIEYLNIN